MRDNQARESMADSRQILLAILALLVDERESRVADQPGARRTELVLSTAGLDAAVIAALLNKQVAAVRMAIYRAGKKGATSKESPSA